MKSVGSRMGFLALMVAGGLVAVAPAPARAVSSTFDSDLEGWQAIGVEIDVTIGFPPVLNAINLIDNAGDMVHEATDGNPGGYARFTDSIEEPSSLASAPAAYLGDLTSFIGGTFSFEHRLFDTGEPSIAFSPYVLLITSGDPTDLNTLVWTAPAPTGATDWVHFDITLDASDLTLLENVPVSVIDPSLPSITPASLGFTGTMTLEEILADVTSILVSFELVNNQSVQNSEHGGIDNVEMVPIPEPASATLLLFGLALLARSRRRAARP
jgi:PEP-CTERM motif